MSLSTDSTAAHGIEDAVSRLPWYRQVTRDQWRAFWAVFLGWIVDSFDFNILTFILIDIQQSFTVDRALAGALGTVTLVMRLVGGTIAGTMADKWGRKLPLMLSVLWFSLFAFLSGFSTSYAMLFALRALFGLGMGGEWAAGMPLVLEHWPAQLRGLASGLLLGGWYWGYLLAAAPSSSSTRSSAARPTSRWRAMFWVAHRPGALHAVDPRDACRRARCGSNASGAGRKAARGDASWTSRRSRSLRIFQRDLIWHDDPDDARDRRVHVHLLLGELLVPDVPARRRPADAAVSGGVQHRRHRRHRRSGAGCRKRRLGRRGAATVTVVLGHRLAAALPARHHGTADCSGSAR